jgi:hypothetical protein
MRLAAVANGVVTSCAGTLDGGSCVPLCSSGFLFTGETERKHKHNPRAHVLTVIAACLSQALCFRATAGCGRAAQSAPLTTPSSSPLVGCLLLNRPNLYLAVCLVNASAQYHPVCLVQRLFQVSLCKRPWSPRGVLSARRSSATIRTHACACV